MPTAAGYSGTPLGKKLGYRDAMRVYVDGMADPIRHAVEQSVDIKPDWLFVPEPALDAAHIFVTERAAMETKLAALRTLIDPSGFVWVSWPKKASKVPTDITEDVIRAAILPTTDWVDVKVCAIDEVWSALKLMIRKERR
ncbi:hypothetical protein [Sphingomonas jaspsi]|uniref:hypothetical protein n=1 Tax=Sphingomonas jaspsi TaxID=392409 RepID=UPI0004BA6C75|nr:hypothetical protein [Sphingomonas jaspsi]